MTDLRNTTIKGYKIAEPIGAGGFSTVYRARQQSIRREVALKVILPRLANKPDFIRRFENEAQIIARLEHLHITPLYDFWREPDGAYLVMRYLRGGSLAGAIKERPYDLPSAARLLDQVAAALHSAHLHDIVHRDVKPSNILLDEDGNAYLSDFGIARDQSLPGDGLTEADAIVGSLDYLSPEQARSEPVTSQTDIYSLGVTLYELIAGHHPFHEFSSVERLYKHINDPLPPLTNLADESVQARVNDIIAQATAKNPAQRQADVLALAAAFRAAVAGDGSAVDLAWIEQFTPREMDILELLVQGLTNKQIAQELVVTVSTVKWYNQQIFSKLNVRSRAQAMARVRELNLLGGEEAAAADGKAVYDQTATSIYRLPEPENPYKGLRAFQAGDRRDFFGREKLVDRLVKRLGEAEVAQRFLAVVGPSGSGKSSVVKAGLIPALIDGRLPGSDRWFIVDMLPGSRPVDKLEVAMLKVAANQANNLHEQLSRDGHGLIRAADLILPDDDSRLVIVIDQFEEVFTLVEDEAARQHFLDLLYAAATAPRSRVQVIVTLRADYYDRPLQYAQFGELLRGRMETILPLSARELERAIQGPVERLRVTFEPGLVAQIVAEMTYQAGALPLLQYALTELFERRQERLLTHAAYQEIGGAVGALARRAETTFRELSEAGQAEAEQMFLRLVTLGEGAEDTRRRVNRSELLAVAADADQMDEVIDTFAAFRLLSLDNDPATRSPTVEVAHEAILREWERLREWVNAARDDIRLQRQLVHLAGEWAAGGEDASYLLRGSRLEQFEGWAAATTLALTARERAYLAQSQALRERRAAEQAAREARESALERRSQTVLRALVGVFAVALVIALGLTAFAFSERGRASDALFGEQEARATSEANAAEALANAEEAAANAEEADANAAEADVQRQQAEDNAAEANTQRALAEDNAAEAEAQRLIAEDNEAAAEANAARARGAVLALALNQAIADGDVERARSIAMTSATSAEENPVAATLLVQAAALDPEYIIKSTISSRSSFVDVFHDGRGALATGSGFNIGVYDFELLGMWNDAYLGHDGDISALDSGDELAVSAAVSTDKTIHLWHMLSVARVGQFDFASGLVQSLILSDDDATVYALVLDCPPEQCDLNGNLATALTAVFDNPSAVSSEIISWDVASGAEKFRYAAAGASTQLYFLPAGNRLLLVQADGMVQILDGTTGALLETVLWPGVAALAISPAEDRIVVVEERLNDDNRLESRVVVRETAGWTPLQQLPWEKGSSTAAFAGDSQHLMVMDAEGQFRVIDLATLAVRELVSRQAGSGARLDSSSDGVILVSRTRSELFLWNFSPDIQRAITRNFQSISNSALAVAISPDGRLALIGSGTVTFQGGATETGEAILLDFVTGEQLFSFPEVGGTVWTVAFSNDGSLAAAGSQDGFIHIWDTESGQLVYSIDTFPLVQTGPDDFPRTVIAIAFSPDDSQLFAALTNPYGPSNSDHFMSWTLQESGPQLLYNITYVNSLAPFAIAVHPFLPIVAVGAVTARSPEDEAPIILLDSNTGEVLKEYPELLAYFTGTEGLAFSPDGKYLFFSSFASGEAFMMDVETGAIIHRLQGHSNGGHLVAVTSDGRFLVTTGGSSSTLIATGGNGAIVWDTESGEELLRFDGFATIVRGVAIAPDNNFALITLLDGSIHEIPLAKEYVLNWMRENRPVQQLTCQQAVDLELTCSRVVGEAADFFFGNLEILGYPCLVQECDTLNLKTDALREFTGADIALLHESNAFTSVNSNLLEPGEITEGDVDYYLSHKGSIDHIVTLELSGAVIREALEHGASIVYVDEDGQLIRNPEIQFNTYRFLHASGLRYSYDPQAAVGQRILTVEVWQNGVWVPLDDEQTYTVAMDTDMASGGYGYYMFVEHRQNLQVFDATLFEALVAYIGAHTPISPVVEGRITVVMEE